jgi:hypothetical protein
VFEYIFMNFFLAFEWLFVYWLSNEFPKLHAPFKLSFKNSGSFTSFSVLIGLPKVK